MKQFVLGLLLMAACTCTGCGHAAGSREQAPDSSRREAPSPSVNSAQASPADAPDLLSLPDGLPTAPAAPGDLDASGGYLLLGEIPEEDLALYCDNAPERTRAYLRYGESFQAFDQDAWADPTILPELEWADWDEDGTMDLIVKYLRHQGAYFDGTTTLPGLVCEEVVYQWDGSRWTDIHFYSGGGYQAEAAPQAP